MSVDFELLRSLAGCLDLFCLCEADLSDRRSSALFFLQGRALAYLSGAMDVQLHRTVNRSNV